MTVSKKILVVEDEALSALQMRIGLENDGYQVIGPVATGKAALEYTRQFSPDLILMDIRLAGDMDGIQAAEQIREYCDVRFIFMSGYSDERLLARAQALQPVAYLVKPVPMADLLATIVSSLA